MGMFVGSTLVAITFMGGVYAILPAYEADLFGEYLRHQLRISHEYFTYEMVFGTRQRYTKHT